MAVIAIAGDHLIAVAGGHLHADDDRFLADIEMAEAADEAHAVQLAGLFLEAADEQHALEGGNLLLAGEFRDLRGRSGLSRWRKLSGRLVSNVRRERQRP